jgi:hypothetical protein
VTRRGLLRTSNRRHRYDGRDVGRGQRQRSKAVRGLRGVLTLADLERLLTPQRERGRREPAMSP